MEEQKKPGKPSSLDDEQQKDVVHLTPEMEVSDNDDEIIELTQIVDSPVPDSPLAADEPAPTTSEAPDTAGAAAIQPPENTMTDAAPASAKEEDDDDIIDLTEVIEPETAAPSAGDIESLVDKETPGDIIELTDIVEAVAAGVAEPAQPATEQSPESSQDEEEILELSDIVETPQMDESGNDTPVPDIEPVEALELGEVESVIDQEMDALIIEDEPEAETVEPDGDVLEPTTEPDVEMSSIDDSMVPEEQVAEATEQIIPIAAAMAETGPDQEAGTEQPDGVIEPAAETPQEDHLVDTIGFEIEDEAAPLPEGQQPSAAQVTAALANFIETRYADRIEQMVVAAIESAVAEEIRKIRKALLDEADDIE